jgi:hypothetical protein
VLNGQTLTSPSCFTYTAASEPVVTAILPSSGTKIGGTRVTIVGSGFAAPVQVFFGGTLEAQVVSVSPDQIIAITPPANAQGPSTTFPQDVSVTVKEVNCSGAACTGGPVTYTYTVGMSIFAFTPDQGDATTLVTITGQGFVAPLIVTFSGTQGTVVSVTGTQILAKPPDLCSADTTPITVTLLSDGETASSSGSFLFHNPSIKFGPSPAIGPGGSPTPVTIGGSFLFEGSDASTLGVTAQGGSASVASVSGSGLNTTVVLNLTPEVCSPSMTVVLQNTVTGCSTSFSFTNSTFIGTGPTAAFISASGSGHDVSFTPQPTGGTTPYLCSWTFQGQNTTPPNPQSTSFQTCQPITVTFDCGTSTPACTTPASATLTVKDACGKTSAPLSKAVTPP